MNIAIASGKGGTGKTTVAVNLALALSMEKYGVQLLDCDVEEPNDHLFLEPSFSSSWEVGIPVPRVDLDKCTFCGRCAEVCAFNALAVLKDQVMILDELCHGCGSCTYLCPEKAIKEVERPVGVVEKGTAFSLDFAHGILNPGEAMSPPLINAVKKLVNPEKITIIDVPPGTSCPVVSAVGGCDFCLLVTDPTPFGLNDLDLAYRMVLKLGLPAGVVINRCDVGGREVEDYCTENGLRVLQKIPFDRELARLYAGGKPVVFQLPAWRSTFLSLFGGIVDARKEALQG